MNLYTVTNPATGNTEGYYPTANEARIEEALSAAEGSFEVLRGMSPGARSELLTRVADLHEARRKDLAEIVTREMGKPISQALAEVDIVVSIYRYYADNGPDFLQDEPIAMSDGGKATVRKEGIGPLLGIMPWNFPYYQAARFVAPNLMLGNPILLKPAPQCPESALAMQAIFDDAGAPSGSYATLLATNPQIEKVIADSRVHGVSLTGSERAGAAVAEAAGRHLKKVVLELGGSDPFIVLEDVDLETVVQRAVAGRMVNGGQACNAAKRFVVMEAVYEGFVRAFCQALAAIAPGDPTAPGTYLGPLSSHAAADQLQAQLDAAVAEGATLLLSGGKVAADSAYFRPAVIGRVTRDMDAYGQEFFGPVAMVFKAATESEAVAIANDTAFGLGASVHSGNTDRAARIGERLAAGMVRINECGGTAAELPFGGVKRSGIGRELGRYGMDEFVNKKLLTLKD